MRPRRLPFARRVPPPDRRAAAATPTAERVAPKPYLYIEELTALVPWTAEAIRTKVRRGELQRGVHYFQERHRARLIFKWDAIVAFIERPPASNAVAAPGRKPRGVLNVEQATTALRRLLEEPCV